MIVMMMMNMMMVITTEDVSELRARIIQPK